MDVTRTITIDGGLMPSRVLAQMLREEGVRVDGTPDSEERRGVEWSADAQQYVTTLIATGTLAGIGAAVAKFRKRFPRAKAEVKDDRGNPDDAGFLGE